MAIAALFAILQAPLTSEAAGEKKLEVFSWWTPGDEAAALNGLFNVYKKQDPELKLLTQRWRAVEVRLRGRFCKPV